MTTAQRHLGLMMVMAYRLDYTIEAQVITTIGLLAIYVIGNFLNKCLLTYCCRVQYQRHALVLSKMIFAKARPALLIFIITSAILLQSIYHNSLLIFQPKKARTTTALLRFPPDMQFSIPIAISTLCDSSCHVRSRLLKLQLIKYQLDTV